MSTRIVEVSSDGCYLSKDRGFLVIRQKDEVLGKVPIDDIGTLLCSAHGLSYSNNLIQALVENKSSVAFCGDNYMPYAWVLPVGVNHVQSMRFRIQSQASKPLLKQMWKKLVQSKILMQARVLEYLGVEHEALKKMAQQVRSDDSSNLEARAARYYWPRMLGDDFRRDQDKKDANAFLNYGYTVVRSAIARFVVAAGLHPSLGIHHSNRYNTFCLIDDLLEPFRPLVDIRVRKLAGSSDSSLDQPAKLKLVETLSVGLNTGEGKSALQNVIETMAILLPGIYDTKDIPKDWPLMIPDDEALQRMERLD